MKLCDVCEREMFVLSVHRKRHATCRKPLSEEQKLALKLKAFERANQRDVAAGRSTTNPIGTSARSQRRRLEALYAA